MIRACRPALLAIAAVLCIDVPIALAQPKGKPAAAGDRGELWELTMKMEMPGMPMAMPATTNRVCLRKDAGDDQFVPAGENCRLTDSRRTGDTFRFRMACTGPNAMNGEGEFTRRKDAYDGRIRLTGRMEGQDVDMTQTFSGRTLGECTLQK